MRNLRAVALIGLVVAMIASASAQKSGFVIAGVVVDERTGMPLSKTSITIAPTTAQEQTQKVITGENGAFRFEGLSQGKYSLMGRRRGYPLQAFEQHENYSSAIAVAPDQDTTKIVFRLHREASIEGKIADETNDPAPQVAVWLFATLNDMGQRSTRLLSQTNTNDIGEYSFGHLEPGTYYVMALGNPWYVERGQMAFAGRGVGESQPNTTPEHRQLVEEEAERLKLTYPLTFYDDAHDSSQALAIDLSSGDHFTADFRLIAVRAATLRIGTSTPTPSDTSATADAPPFDPTNRREMMRRMRPVQLMVRMFDDQVIPVGGGFSRQGDGRQEVTGIAPGRYVVQSIDADGRPSMQELDISSDMDLPSLNSAAGASVSGKIVWDGEGLKRGYNVVLTNSHTMRNYFCMAEPNGEFKVAESVLPGKYEVAAQSRNGEAFVKSVEIGGISTGTKVQIADGADVNMTITLGRGTGAIEGTALMDGKPKAGVMVVMVPSDGWVGVARFRRDQSDSDGTFLLRNVVPGAYKVVALRDGWRLPWSDAKTMQAYLKEGTEVQISPNGRAKITVNVK